MLGHWDNNHSKGEESKFQFHYKWAAFKQI
jgi:hypothetical protein